MHFIIVIVNITLWQCTPAIYSYQLGLYYVDIFNLESYLHTVGLISSECCYLKKSRNSISAIQIPVRHTPVVVFLHTSLPPPSIAATALPVQYFRLNTFQDPG